MTDDAVWRSSHRGFDLAVWAREPSSKVLPAYAGAAKKGGVSLITLSYNTEEKTKMLLQTFVDAYASK